MKQKDTEKLNQLRDEIDSIDKKLVELLGDRTRVVLEVGKTKTEGKGEFYQPDRERAVFKKLLEMNQGPFPADALRNIYREIMSASLSLEKPLKIAFLGPSATFTHQAAMKHFGISAEFVPKADIEDVFYEVERGKADFGVVPIESTAEGVVSHTLDMFVSSELKISAEIQMEVSTVLMNKTGKLSDIEKICSNPHAIAQSSKWLKENLPNIPTMEVTSTADAAQRASDDTTSAALSGAAAASMYDLQIIEEKIQDNPHNYTRFLVIGTKEYKKSGTDKTSVMFAVKDSPGALFDILKPFATRKINLTKIESRPLKKKAWEYVFFIDLDGHSTDDGIKDAIKELSDACSFVKVLGSYPRSEKK